MLNQFNNKSRQGIKSNTLTRQGGQENLGQNMKILPVKSGSFVHGNSSAAMTSSNNKSFKRSQVRVIKTHKSAVGYSNMFSASV